MSAYLISQILLFVYFYKSLKDIYEDIERIKLAFYKLKLATLDVVGYYILRLMTRTYYYMTDIQFN
jgi:hypothetical protein